jgi:hypothetical protein
MTVGEPSLIFNDEEKPSDFRMIGPASKKQFRFTR